MPVLVAVNAKGILSRHKDFDAALFGRSVQPPNSSDTLSPQTFRADGRFAAGEGQPTISGVLAYTEVEFLRCSEPVLYIHPRFEGDLSDALLQLESRTLSADSISVPEAQNRGFLEVLGFVDRDS